MKAALAFAALALASLAGAQTYPTRPVTLVTPGTCSIRATQAGNGSFNAATPVIRSFQVLPEGSIVENNLYLPIVAR